MRLRRRDADVGRALRGDRVDPLAHPIVSSARRPARARAGRATHGVEAVQAAGALVASSASSIVSLCSSAKPDSPWWCLIIVFQTATGIRYCADVLHGRWTTCTWRSGPCVQDAPGEVERQRDLAVGQRRRRSATATTSRSAVHGTSRPNVIAPVNECTIVLACVHRKLRVVDGQRSGAPKSSNSVLARLGVVLAPRGIEVDLRGQRDRVDRRGRSARRRSARSAASAARRTARARRRGPRRSPRVRSRASPVPAGVGRVGCRRSCNSCLVANVFEELGHRIRYSVAAGDALPVGLDQPDEAVALVDRHDRVLGGSPSMRLTTSASPSASSSLEDRVALDERVPALEVQLGLGRAGGARVQRHDGAGARSSARRTPARSGSWNAAHSSSGKSKSSSHSVRVPTGQ